MLDFISGGIIPSKFLVNIIYNKINQKRNIDVINLNDIFKKEFNFSENQIKLYFENNKDNYKEIYKSVKFLELSPKKLTGNDEFNDLFFKKIDEIDDMIIQGKNLNQNSFHWGPKIVIIIKDTDLLQVLLMHQCSRNQVQNI